MDALTPITEGVTPNAEQVTKWDITATVQQYGKVVELSDDVIITVQDQTSNEVAKIGHYKPTLMDLEFLAAWADG